MRWIFFWRFASMAQMCVKGKDLREYNSALGGDQPPGQVAVPEQRHQPHATGAMPRQGMVMAFYLGVLIPFRVKSKQVWVLSETQCGKPARSH